MLMGQSIPPDRESLLNGEGAGMAQVADKNGYPGPAHVLGLAEELQLSASQKNIIDRIVESMRSAAKKKGEEIVRCEVEFDSLFKTGRVDSASIGTMAARIAALRAELRAIHLQAHLLTREVLTPGQIEKYSALRFRPQMGHENH
jgi:Spy/CpxP family protein refolding chaperone